MTRRAYIGVSGPLAYDYKNTGDTFDSRENSAPNPLLEDSLGLIVCYDELVFLSRHLCPRNMRELPYVSFLNDRSDFAELFAVAHEQAKTQYKVPDKRDKTFSSPWDLYIPALSNVTGQPSTFHQDTATYFPDNHTHEFYVHDSISVTGSSTWFHNVLLDWITKDAFDLRNCDVVSNSGNHVFYEHLSEHPTEYTPRVAVGQHLVARRLPNYLTREGPYHESLEELRNHHFLEDMRRYLDDLLIANDRQEIAKTSEELVRLAAEYRQNVFQQYLVGANEYWTVGKAAVTDIVGSVLPGIGTLHELMGARRRTKERQRLRWAGFVTDLAAES